MAGEGYVPLSVLAQDLHMHKTHVKTFALKHGFQVTKVRTRAAGNQETLALSANDADALRELRQKWMGHENTTEQNGSGWFYLIQPVPDLDPTRVKLGFATDVTQRLNQYRTICPESTIVKTWPCRVTWEHCAIASLTRVDCIRLGQEIFRCADLQLLLTRGDSFFALLPNPHVG